MTSDELLQKLERPELYIAELTKLNTSRRKQEFLALRFALKELLDGEEKKIIYTNNGKPILEDNSYKVSFSHCKTYVAVMIHPTLDVGIDIEKPSDQLITVHQRFLGKEELEHYNKTLDFNYLRVAWSAKEALYKIIGVEAYNFAKQLSIPPLANFESGNILATHMLTGKEYDIYYSLNDEYTLAYCLNNDER